MDYLFSSKFQFIQIGVLAVLLVLITACSANKQTPKESDSKGVKVTVQIVVSPSVNPNAFGQSAPVQLDLYQLSSATEFEQAGYFDLIQNEKGILGNKLIQHDKYMLYPDTIKIIPMQLDSNLKYMGIVGSFRRLENNNWRLLLLKQDKQWYRFGGNYLYVYVDHDGLTQLSKAEMQEKLKEFEARNPENHIVRNGKARREKIDMNKGVFRQVNNY